MGNNLWLQKWENGAWVALDMDALADVFGQHTSSRDGSCWVLDLGDGGGELYYRPGDNSAMFAHFGGARLIALIFDYLKRTCSIAFWPDEAPSGAVADAAAMVALPQDMVDAIAPVLVSSPVELEKAICRS